MFGGRFFFGGAEGDLLETGRGIIVCSGLRADGAHCGCTKISHFPLPRRWLEVREQRKSKLEVAELADGVVGVEGGPQEPPLDAGCDRSKPTPSL